MYIPETHHPHLGDEQLAWYEAKHRCRSAKHEHVVHSDTMHWYLVLKLELDAPVYSEFLGVLVMIVFPINTWIDDLVVCHLTGQRLLELA